MEVFVILVSLVLSSIVAHAALSVVDTNACKNAPIQRDSFVSAAVKKQNYELCISTKTNAQEATTLRSQIATLKDQEATCFKDGRGMFDRIMNNAQVSPTAADVQRCEAERTAKEARLTTLEDNQKVTAQQLKVAEASYAAQRDAATAAADQKAKTDALVRGEFDSFQISILNSRWQAADAALKLTKMATALDNSAMGLYLRERMAGLLNSDVMCAAVKECPKPRQVKGSDLNSVFNSTMNTGVNSEREVNSTAPAGKAAPASTNK